MNLLMIMALFAMISPGPSERPFVACPQDMVLFTENCEGEMSQWIGQSTGAHNGAIVHDPLNPENHVITFFALADMGDIFSTELPSYHAFVYFLRFDYLGLPKEGTPEGSTGGRIGIADDLPGATSFWMAATTEEDCTEKLIDDGQWHSYVLFFFPECVPGIANGNFRIMMEDWCGRPPEIPQGVSGDVFFDNIQIDIHEVAVQSTSWGAFKMRFQ